MTGESANIKPISLLKKLLVRVRGPKRSFFRFLPLPTSKSSLLVMHNKFLPQKSKRGGRGKICICVKEKEEIPTWHKCSHVCVCLWRPCSLLEPLCTKRIPPPPLPPPPPSSRKWPLPSNFPLFFPSWLRTMRQAFHTLQTIALE